MTRASPCMVRILLIGFGSLELLLSCRKCRARQGRTRHSPRHGYGYQRQIEPAASGAVAAVRAALAGGTAGAGDRLIHDAADGARAATTLGAAAEAAVDLAGGARGPLGRDYGP